MTKKDHQDQMVEFCPRFGKIAVDMGFATPRPGQAGINGTVGGQSGRSSSPDSRHHFFEHDWMTASEVEAVVNRLVELTRAGKEKQRD